MQLLEKPKTDQASADPYYDLFEGGYIEASDFVIPEDAEKVDAAVEVIKDFFKTLEEAELLEEM